MSDHAGSDDTHDEDDRERSNGPKGGHPGPVDGGGNGGMATRENAPDLAESD